MAREIERKFLVRSDDWRDQVVTCKQYHQAYLNDDLRLSSIRVRIEGDQAKLNIKSIETGMSREEFEYDIPMSDAEYLLGKLSVTSVLSKQRHTVPYLDEYSSSAPQSLIWEIDEFQGDNEGLIVAEIELPSEDFVIQPPAWLGKEVTHDKRYYNVALIQTPYTQWNHKI